MTLSFPNPSRGFNTTRNCVCFWGYQDSIEVSFFLDVSALQKLTGGKMETEADCLEAFDAASDQIHKVAARIHKKRGGGVYSHALSVKDL